MTTQAQQDKAHHDALRCKTCGEVPISGHRQVQVNGELRDCPELVAALAAAELENPTNGQ